MVTIYTDPAVGLILNIVFGGICAVIANGRGRSGVAWFLLGFFLGCLALIILLVIPDLRVEQERHSRVARENRRLREQLRKDRMVADARHEDAQRRLQAHDRALGVDTSPARPDLLAGSPQQDCGWQIQGQMQQPAGPATPTGGKPFVHPAGGVPNPEHASKQWYFADHDGRQGPVSFQILRSLWSQRTITPQTYVWTEGMSDWAAIASVGGLAESLDVA